MNPISSQERMESIAPEHAPQTARYGGRTGDNSLGRALGYFILRLSLGVDMAMHYVVRTWGISKDSFRSRRKCLKAIFCRCRGCTRS